MEVGGARAFATPNREIGFGSCRACGRARRSSVRAGAVELLMLGLARQLCGGRWKGEGGSAILVPLGRPALKRRVFENPNQIVVVLRAHFVRGFPVKNFGTTSCRFYVVSTTCQFYVVSATCQFYVVSTTCHFFLCCFNNLTILCCFNNLSS